MERMSINGMEIKEIRDVQDALAAFQTMNITAEIIVEELAKRAAEYSAIIDSFDRNHSQHGEMIAALSEEQMKLQQLSVSIEKMSQATAMNAQKMLAQFQTNVQQTIDAAFRKVDNEAVHRSLQQTIEKSLSRVNTGSIEKAADSMNNGAAKIDQLNRGLNTTLHQINSAIREYNNTVVNNFNKKALIATGSIAMLFGLSIGWIVKAEITASDYLDWIVPGTHQFHDDMKNANFIRFSQAEAENRGDGFFYVKIKQFSH